MFFFKYFGSKAVKYSNFIEIKYIQNKREACEPEHHQQNEVLAVEPQSELDLIKKNIFTFSILFSFFGNFLLTQKIVV